MDTTLHQKFPFILDRNLAKANCTEDRVCTSCDIVVLDLNIKLSHSVNGSNVWGSLAPFGDDLPVFKWNIYKRSTFPSKLS